MKQLYINGCRVATDITVVSVESPQLADPVGNDTSQSSGIDNGVIAIAVLAVVLVVLVICVILLIIFNFKLKMQLQANDNKSR